MRSRKPRTLVSMLTTLLIVALVIIIYGYGWRVTQIDLKTLITDAPDVLPIVTALLQPRILQRATVTQSSETPFAVPCPENLPPLPAPAPDAPALTLSARCAPVGAQVTIEGTGFHPSAQGYAYLLIVNFQRRLGTFTTDAEGHFRLIATVPELRAADLPLQAAIGAQASWQEGPLRPTEPLRLTIEKMIETLFLALIATTFGIVIAVPLSFLGARNLMGRNTLGVVIYYLTRTILNLLRAIEPLILAIVFAVWVGIGPFAGVLALAVHSIASLGKLYSEAIESIDPGPIEAITATGANRLQTVLFAVVPQIVPQYIAFTIYRWDINVRMSTIIGFVGGGGIGFILQQWINLMQYRNAAVAVWAIAIVVATLDYVSAKVREKVV